MSFEKNALEFNLNPKKMNRHHRLKFAKQWAEATTTHKKIKAYMKYFGVDKLCAAKELKLAGVALQEKYAEKWATRNERKALNRKRKPALLKPQDSVQLNALDENFYFVAGHTSNGFPYGLAWDEALPPLKEY